MLQLKLKGGTAHSNDRVSDLILSNVVERNLRPKMTPRGRSHQNELSIAETGVNVLDVFYYDIVDPCFGDIASSLLSKHDTGVLLKQVEDIWTQASRGMIQLRFHHRETVLDHDRAAAYLMYVIGHPAAYGTREHTQEWLMKNLGLEVDRLRRPLKQVYLTPSLIEMMERALKKPNDGGIDRATYNAMAERALEQGQPQGRQGQLASKQPHEPSGEVSLEGLQLAFDGLSGAQSASNAEDWVITRESLEDFTSLRNRSQQMKDVHLAFRLFYIRHVGLTMSRVLELAQMNRDRPMLLMQYAIGRDADLETHAVNRSPWEFANTISIYPVPFYHDMNGRGSQNWMDVIFRTASCWDHPSNARSNLHKHVVIKGKDFGPIPCRWGVRKWEQHEYSLKELGRMVAHEIGHCVGLPHVRPHCIVYPSIAKANLMQQQRNIGLREWKGRCACLASSPSCGECYCPWDDVNFRQVGEARYLEDSQIDIALGEIRRRDVLETPVEPLYKRVGPSFANYIANNGSVMLTQGDILVLREGDDDSINNNERIRLVNQMHIRARLRGDLNAFKSSSAAGLKLWAVRRGENSDNRETFCAEEGLGSLKRGDDKRWRDLDRFVALPKPLTMSNAHFEWPGLNNVELLAGELLAVEFVAQDPTSRLAVATSSSLPVLTATTTSPQRPDIALRGCIARLNTQKAEARAMVTDPGENVLMINYDYRDMGSP